MNNDNYIYPNTKGLTCRKIRFREDLRRKFCRMDGVRTNCPVSCGLCCNDDPNYNFTNKVPGVVTEVPGVINCELIQKTESLQLRFCNKYKNGIMVKNACSDTCSNCPLEVSLSGEIVNATTTNEDEDTKPDNSDIYVGIVLGSSFILLVSYGLSKKRKKWTAQTKSMYEKRKKQKMFPPYNKQLTERKEALLQTEESLGRDHVANAVIHFDIGTLFKAKGKKKQSLESFWNSVTLQKGAYGKNNVNVAALYCNIAEVYLMQKDYDRSHRSYRKALSIHENLSGKNNTNSALIHMKIGSVQKKEGNFDESLKSSKIALSMEEKISGKNHPKTFRIHKQAGSVLYAKKDFKSAFVEYQCALEILIDTLERDYFRKQAKLREIHYECGRKKSQYEEC